MGATVTLYEAGTNYGVNTSSPLGTATTDASGSFTMDYIPPATPPPIIYPPPNACGSLSGGTWR